MPRPVALERCESTGRWRLRYANGNAKSLDAMASDYIDTLRGALEEIAEGSTWPGTPMWIGPRARLALPPPGQEERDA